MVNQIIKELQNLEAARRAQAERERKSALSDPNGKDADRLFVHASFLEGEACGLSMAVLVLKNKQYELRGED